MGTCINFLRARLKNPLRWRIALAAYLVGLAAVGFWPSPVDKPISGVLASTLKFLHGFGVPNWLDYHFVEASANVALFIPLGFLTAMAFPAKAWWRLSAIGVLASFCMEVGQMLFLAARFSSLTDVVTNTFGAVIGIISARLVTRLVRLSPRKQQSAWASAVPTQNGRS